SRIEPLKADVAERVVAMTLTDPPGETTHWTGAMMAEAIGISVSSVQRIWRAHGLQPHRVRQFKLSNDPKFIDKLRDVVGLYVDPPAHAIVLSVDEKSQIQALDRTQPGLPLKQGRAGTMTHDYKRHGTTTLFAALNVLDGTVIGRNMQRHRHQEFSRTAMPQIDPSIHRFCAETGKLIAQRFQRGRYPHPARSYQATRLGASETFQRVYPKPAKCLQNLSFPPLRATCDATGEIPASQSHI